MWKTRVHFWRAGVKRDHVKTRSVVPIDSDTDSEVSVNTLDSPVRCKASVKPGISPALPECQLSRLPIDCINQVFYYLNMSDSVALLQVCNSHAVMRTWCHTENNWAGTWFIKLYRDVGPEPQRLRKPEESYQVAYQRHMQQLQQIPTALDSLAAIGDLFEKYPHYHAKRLVHEASIDQVLSQLEPHLIVLCTELQLYPKSNEIVMQRLLSQNKLFLRFFHDCQDLMRARQWFVAQWPMIMDKVLGNTSLFLEIFKERSANADPVMATFGAYARRIVGKMCAQSDIFVKIIASTARLNSFTANFEGYHYEQYCIHEKYRQFHGRAPAPMVDFKIAAVGPWLKMSDWLDKRCTSMEMMAL